MEDPFEESKNILEYYKRQEKKDSNNISENISIDRKEIFMAPKLSNVTLEKSGEEEWGITFHFGNSAKETIWVYKGMNARGVIQQTMGAIKRLIDNYM